MKIWSTSEIAIYKKRLILKPFKNKEELKRMKVTFIIKPGGKIVGGWKIFGEKISTEPSEWAYTRKYERAL